MNLASLPDRRAKHDPEGPSVADDDNDLNNNEFLAAVQRAAAALQAHGVSAGDVFAVMLPNTSAFVVALFAAWRLGVAVTPINPFLVAAEVAYQVSDAAAQVLVVDKPLDFDVSAPAVVTAGDLTAHPASFDGAAEPVDDEALALLIYTSGTTGRPKGVMLDHANLNAMCGMIINALQLSSADHSLLILPLFHANGIILGTLSPSLPAAESPSPADSAHERSSTGSSVVARPIFPRYRPSTTCWPTSRRRCVRTRRPCGSGSAVRPPRASSCCRGSMPATAFRSSRAMGCPKDRA